MSPGAPAALAARLAGLAAMLDAAALAPGLRVLDYGSRDGWSGTLLEASGCQACFAAPPGSAAPPGHLLHDGIRLDLPAASQDRVLCHRALFAADDPGGLLADFARILTPGGRAVLLEEAGGPEIAADRLRLAAEECGFVRLDRALFGQQALLLPPAAFTALLAEGPAEAAEIAALRALARPALEGVRLFVLHRAAGPAQDSLQREGLAAGIALLRARRVEQGFRLVLRITNTGDATWLPSGGQRGAVNLGLLLLQADGSLADQNWRRHRFLKAPLAPGEAVETGLLVPLPAGAQLSLDLVAEHVRWFSEPGTGQRVALPD